MVFTTKFSGKVTITIAWLFLRNWKLPKISVQSEYFNKLLSFYHLIINICHQPNIKALNSRVFSKHRLSCNGNIFRYCLLHFMLLCCCCCCCFISGFALTLFDFDLIIALVYYNQEQSNLRQMWTCEQQYAFWAMFTIIL